LFDKISVPEGAAIRDVATFLASGAGVGLSRWAPGTMGSALGVAVVWPIEEPSLILCWSAWALATVTAIWAAQKAGKSWGVVDHPAIVIDEVVGVWLAILLPMSLLSVTTPSLNLLISCLLVFRVYDIVKPWPVNWSERRFKGGLGVVSDDLVAGAMAGFCVTAGYIVAKLLSI
jgi:phosphatidylglycerophosphatase A